MQPLQRLAEPLVVPRQATESRHPAVGPLHDPTARQEHEPTLRLGQTDNVQVDAVVSRVSLRFVAGVTLIDECQFDRLPGCLLHRLGKNGDLVPLLLVGGGDVQGQRCPSVSTAM